MSMDVLLLRNKNILLAEDDKVVREQMGATLEMVFREVFVVKDGEEAFRVYEEKKPDILLVDIMMPKKDGLKLVKQIREKDYDTPIVMLSSFSDQEYLMKALNLSVDGYLIKPIALQNIIDTLCSALKRRTSDVKIIRLAKDIYYNSGTREVIQKGAKVPLGSKELELLTLLIDNYARVVTKDDIENRLWMDKPACHTALKCIVSRIRKKLGEGLVVSVRGVGYKIYIEPEANNTSSGGGGG